VVFIDCRLIKLIILSYDSLDPSTPLNAEIYLAMIEKEKKERPVPLLFVPKPVAPELMVVHVDGYRLPAVNSSLHSFAGFLPKCCCHSLGINP
jgi:hypothetical protein